MEEKKKKMDAECKALKEDVEDLENTLAKAEQDKQTKDNQIKTLQDEMAAQDDANAKLSKEKKNLEEAQKKTLEDLQAEEDKVNHLNKLKAKLEQTLDEVSTFCCFYIYDEIKKKLLTNIDLFNHIYQSYYIFLLIIFFKMLNKLSY